MKKIFILLSLVSLSACGEEQPNVLQHQQTLSTDKEDTTNTNVNSDKKDWDNAKISTQQAFQDIWDASKESTQELIDEGSTTSKELWQSSKEKSSELWEQGKESSVDIWNDIESGSKSTWSEGKEKVQQLFPKQSDPINNANIDEI